MSTSSAALHLSSTARVLGVRSAAAAAVLAIVYDIGQLAEWMGWLGSKGGPESSSTPLGLAVLLTPSLFLGPAFLLTMLCLHEAAPPSRKVWSHSAVAFATAYMVMVTVNYFVQLAWVMPRLAAGRVAGMEPFLFVPFDSFLYAVDILGYGFMSAAALAAAQALPRGARTARRFLSATGCLLPFITLQMFWHPLIWPASAWAAAFPGAMLSLVSIFRHAAPLPEDSGPA